MVMEYADKGDFLGAIKEKQNQGAYFKESEIWKYLIQMTIGLKICHDRRIMHRDLKCANVFLNSEGECKLGDFNVSKVMKGGFLSTQTGTPYYASPEIWKDRPYDNKSDIWSLGCILYEICALKPPFRA